MKKPREGNAEKQRADIPATPLPLVMSLLLCGSETPPLAQNPSHGHPQSFWVKVEQKPTCDTCKRWDSKPRQQCIRLHLHMKSPSSYVRDSNERLHCVAYKLEDAPEIHVTAKMPFVSETNELRELHRENMTDVEQAARLLDHHCVGDAVW